MDAVKKLNAFGQSLWYDNIRRGLLEDGTLAGMIEAGDIHGVTSNPSIFQKAVADSDDYETDLGRLAGQGLTAEGIFEQLAVEDIRAAADLFSPVYERTEGGDGYVSIEVSPLIANDTEATIQDARRLWEWVERPNLMVKIPATSAGIPAIERSIADGININITLIFSQDRYVSVMDAYLSGLERRLAGGKSIGSVASVASFFVSRIDSKVDRRLEILVREESENAGTARRLMGRIAIANAKLAYQKFKKVFEGSRFAKLRQDGARVQRPLWASTSTKNPSYSDVLYVENLIGPHTVNTVPPATLQAFKDHGTVEATLETNLDAAADALSQLDDIGLDFQQATAELEREGVQAFADSYKSLLDTVEVRRIASL